MTQIDARDVFDKYIALLKGAKGAVIRDEAELPYPKEVIKIVLKGCFARFDDPAARETLKKAYMDLGSFQPLTKVEREAVEAMSKVTDAQSTDGDLMEQARIIATHGELQQVVAKRSLAEVEALYLEVRGSQTPSAALAGLLLYWIRSSTCCLTRITSERAFAPPRPEAMTLRAWFSSWAARATASRTAMCLRFPNFGENVRMASS